MSVPIRKFAGAGSRRRIKYNEQPFPEPELAKRLVNEQLQSPLFKIPKELRNRIFDLAFQNSDNTIDISALFYREESDTPNSIHDAAAPPSTSLILTCRRIFDECKNAFDLAFSTYWKRDFVINTYEYPHVWRSLDHIPDEFVAHVRKYQMVVSIRGMPVAITLRAKIDGYWYLDASCRLDTSDDQLTALETKLRGKLKKLQGPDDAHKAFQRGRPHDSAFKAFTSDGLRELMVLTADQSV